MNNDTAPTPDKKLVGPAGIIIDIVLTGVFFVFMCGVIYPHTPDFSERGKQLSAAYTSLCLTGVFWITLQCFRVTFADQIRRKKAGETM